VRVSASSARLSDELKPGMYNYGQLQVTFADGSVGWYEAGWGPMMSEVAYFVKDVVGPKGCVSIVDKKAGRTRKAGSADVDSHTKTNSLRCTGRPATRTTSSCRPTSGSTLTDEPDHDQLCLREQQYLLRAIREDLDLTDHLPTRSTAPQRSPMKSGASLSAS
jgi:hypothetical protein